MRQPARAEKYQVTLPLQRNVWMRATVKNVQNGGQGLHKVKMQGRCSTHERGQPLAPTEPDCKRKKGKALRQQKRH
jgi:hypothetical protein